MDYFDAVDEILEKARRIRLPGYRFNVVTIARREFRKNGHCDNKFIAPIEDALRDCLRQWSTAQKREIWASTEIGMANPDDISPDPIDPDLENELMNYIIDDPRLRH